MSNNFFVLAFNEIKFIAEPVLAAAEPRRRARLMRALGWDLEAVSGFDARTFEEWIGKIGPAIEELGEVLADLKPDSLDNLIKIGEAAGKAFEPLGGLPPGLNLPDVAGLPEALADDLIDYLILTYLLRRVRWLTPLLALLGLVTPAAELPPSAALPPGDAPIRLPRRRDELHLERIIEAISRPGPYFTDLYAPKGLETSAGVDAMAARVLPRLAQVLRAFGVDAAYGMRPGIGPDQGEAGLRVAGSLLRVRFAGLRTPGGRPPPGQPAAPWDPTFGIGFTLTFAFWDDLLTLIVAPTGEAHLEGAIGAWNVATDLSGAGAAIGFNSAGVTIAGGGPAVKWAGEIARIAPAGEAGWILGADKGTHLAIGQLVFALRASLGAGRDDVEFGARAGRTEFVLKPAEGDGLLRKLLPEDGLRLGFDLGLAWSLRAGLHLSGAAALVTEFPMHLSAWGIHIEGLRIGIEASSETKVVSLVVSTSVRAELGLLRAVVENLGIRADLSFPPALPSGAKDAPRGGNLGALNLAPRFKHPDGVGLRVEGQIVSGGGYLFVDEPRGMYAGALQLSITTPAGTDPMKGFVLQATAILNTKNVDGTRLTEAGGTETFSLLVAGTFQWEPGCVLFWGITLNGLGLVVGYNRRSNPEEVRNAARAGALDALLFPEDPVGKAPAIIATLSRIFPVDTTGTVLGVMVRLKFLSGQVVADLAIIVEFPDPIRILLLGKLVIDFKKDGKFRLDSAGIVDFASKEITLDAALIDSKLFGFPVSGEMALRARWGEAPAFALSIGGFHPRFSPPPAFPKVKPFSIALQKTGKGLNLEAYLAVTSNTVQFGAALQLHFEGFGVAVAGRAWLDVMFQFDPFWFTAQLGAIVSLKYQGVELLAVTLIIDVSGPSPWRAWGVARIKILAWTVSVALDWTEGDTADAREPAQVNAADLLRSALSRSDAWQAGQVLPGAEPVTLRALEIRGNAMVLRPGSVLGVKQSLFPLGVDLQRVGTSRIIGPNHFTLEKVTVGEAGSTLEGRLGDALFDSFAPGQFHDLSPEEQIMTPGFERLEAGRTVVFPEGTSLPETGLTVFVGLSSDEDYDRVIIDDPEAAPRPMPARPQALADTGGGSLLARFAATGPAANARTRTTGAVRFAAAELGLADAGPSYLLGRAVPGRVGGRRGQHLSPDARQHARTVPTVTQARELRGRDIGGDRGGAIRRVSIPVGRPTIRAHRAGEVT